MSKKAERVLPELFIKRLKELLPPDTYTRVLDAFNTRRPTTFRTNTLKISTADLEKKLNAMRIPVLKVPWYADAFILDIPEQKTLTCTKLYEEGYLYLQNLSSMIPPLILDPQPQETILDLTAAPGSKTTQIAALMHNSGRIFANDKSKIRLYKLDANLKMQGVTNTKIFQKPGQMFWKLYPEYFDRTLVDVPCSMEGRFNTDDKKTFDDWSMKKIKYLVQIQRFLLRSAISTTKPGGIIIYSTCTLAPEENEEIIDWVMRKEGDALSLEPISLTLDNRTEGLRFWKNKKFISDIIHTMRVLPSDSMEGFFIAKIKKHTSTLLKSALKELY